MQSSAAMTGSVRSRRRRSPPVDAEGADTAATRPTIDLYLGSSIGRWALRRFGHRRRGVVFTLDPSLAAEAAVMGLDVSQEDPHDQPTGSDLAISVHYPRIFRTDLLARYHAVYNLHPGLLPWGRGFFPVFWALWEGTPAGATLHLVDEGLDTGPVVLRSEVEYDDLDTGGSLHARVSAAERKLLVKAWRTLGLGEDLPGSPPGPGGSFHSRADFDRLRAPVRADDVPTARLLRLARCLTFPGYPGLVVESNGTRFELAARRLERIEKAGDPRDD